MKQGVTIRSATRQDVDAIVAFCRDVAYFELQWQHVQFDAVALAETLVHLIEGKHGACLLLENGSSVEGFALIFVNRYFFSRERYASDMTFYVAPTARRGWAGVKLIRAMIAYAKDQNVRELLLTVNSGVRIERTVKLIERLGGRALGKSMSISL